LTFIPRQCALDVAAVASAAFRTPAASVIPSGFRGLREDGGSSHADGAPLLQGNASDWSERADTQYECPSPIVGDEHATERSACAFQGARAPRETLAFATTQRTRLPLSHVIVMMKENHSYDCLYGRLHALGQPESEPSDANFIRVFRLPQSRTHPWVRAAKLPRSRCRARIA
jgi:hypothetical protein